MLKANLIYFNLNMLICPGHDGLAHTDTAVFTDLHTYGNAIGTVVKYIETFYINNKLLA